VGRLEDALGRSGGVGFKDWEGSSGRLTDPVFKWRGAVLYRINYLVPPARSQGRTTAMTFESRSSSPRQCRKAGIAHKGA